MKYINERILRELGINWGQLIKVIKNATILLSENKISQPVKPYLRFNDPKNRIIAMPAYVGGSINSAGIKWIASFPDNIKKATKRAHSILILNDADTGAPSFVVNTALLSSIRTASVSGFVLKQIVDSNNSEITNCGIIGFGPIGQLHLEMLSDCFPNRIKNVFIYDLNKIDENLIKKAGSKFNIVMCNSWEEVYEKSNLIITCTVSSKRYVDKSPKPKGIYLNVSLRDFENSFIKDIDINIVDNWEEICRENTDIENAHKELGLSKSDVLEITDVLVPAKMIFPNKSCMFNPMGMAIYDIAVAKYYYDLAIARNNLVELED